ncbi:hypothetical protein jhhlp_003237 [Lomentospora prolificans]|uniref:CST complex subunit Stn1 N-terminal domain-containing protein n=1 Tax=Lomentospora prolificans TaxID=41688 RepID=A0A2N3NGB2_9PEZI|nr:hypothetical protein jhhlp_003237 [Lomentospora prolificans]
MANQGQSVPIYPQYCFKKAPTHNVWCFLRSADIASLRSYREFPGLHFYKQLPIKLVRIVGIIVAVDDQPRYRVYTVDDSSGVNIECVLYFKGDPSRPTKSSEPSVSRLPIPPEFTDFGVGCVVDVKGTISPFRHSRGFRIERMKHVPTTSAELLLWEKRHNFRADILDQPWCLSQQDILRCRKEAESADFELAARKRKESRGRHPDEEPESDPYKITKGVSRLASKRARGSESRRVVPAHEIPTTKQANRKTLEVREEQEAAVPVDPYSLTTKRPKDRTVPIRAKGQAEAQTWKETQDPFRIGSRASTPSIRPAPAPATPGQGDRYSGSSRAREQQSRPIKGQNAIVKTAPDNPHATHGDSSQTRTSVMKAREREPATDPFKITKPISSMRPIKAVGNATNPTTNPPKDPFSIKKDAPLRTRTTNSRERGSGSKWSHDVDDDPFRICKKGARPVR